MSSKYVIWYRAFGNVNCNIWSFCPGADGLKVIKWDKLNEIVISFIMIRIHVFFLRRIYRISLIPSANIYDIKPLETLEGAKLWKVLSPDTPL